MDCTKDQPSGQRTRTISQRDRNKRLSSETHLPQYWLQAKHFESQPSKDVTTSEMDHRERQWTVGWFKFGEQSATTSVVAFVFACLAHHGDRRRLPSGHPCRSRRPSLPQHRHQRRRLPPPWLCRVQECDVLSSASYPSRLSYSRPAFNVALTALFQSPRRGQRPLRISCRWRG